MLCKSNMLLTEQYCTVCNNQPLVLGAHQYKLGSFLPHCISRIHLSSRPGSPPSQYSRGPSYFSPCMLPLVYFIQCNGWYSGCCNYGFLSGIFSYRANSVDRICFLTTASSLFYIWFQACLVPIVSFFYFPLMNGIINNLSNIIKTIWS